MLTDMISFFSGIFGAILMCSTGVINENGSENGSEPFRYIPIVVLLLLFFFLVKLHIVPLIYTGQKYVDIPPLHILLYFWSGAIFHGLFLITSFTKSNISVTLK